MRYAIVMMLFVSGCGFWESVHDAAADPAVQEAVEETVQHIPEVIANPANPYAWYGLIAGIVAVGTAVGAVIKKKRKKKL